MKVSSGNEETSDHSLDVPAGASLDLALSLSGGAVNVDGFAKQQGTARAGVMVVLVPRNPALNRELFRRDQSDLDGSFTLQAVAPGAYTIVAIDGGWDLEWSQPSVIAPYLKSGQAVTIGPQSHSSVHLQKALEVQPRQ